MNILVIGGSGFIGAELISLMHNEHFISNADKNPSFFHSNFTYNIDIREPNQLKEVIKPGIDTVVLLAAEHRDNVTPVSLYYDVNVQGTRNVLEMMEKSEVKRIVFISSVTIYGLNKQDPDEQYPANPFNHYGRSKWQAEELLRTWFNKDPLTRSLTIVRPTVVFGERNRGNVYNLLKQIALRRFIMIGKGINKKSMAYVGNVSAFIKYCIETQKSGYRVYNYSDKPDMNMNELVKQAEKSLNKKILSLRLPYLLGYLVGVNLDLISKLTGFKFSLSAIRVRKFCATTQFDSTLAHSSGFKAPYSMEEGLDRTLKYEFPDAS